MNTVIPISSPPRPAALSSAGVVVIMLHRGEALSQRGKWTLDLIGRSYGPIFTASTLKSYERFLGFAISPSLRTETSRKHMSLLELEVLSYHKDSF